MNPTEDHAKSIFLAALERDPDQWPAYLDEACGGDAPMRARVEELLRAHREMGSIDEGGAGAAAVATLDEPMRECVGMEIGPYKLLQQLGEGGMGTVFLAQQSKPVERMVALKLIKPGMDSRQVIARFEAERQALALMDHPNIARVLDAGTTDSGRPYFVMELVKGMPITKYCDHHRLSPRQRLELFLPVCHAVQHAHQKGIIHRDVKPSNVMVSLFDGKPVPKVIDFGVAKATGSRLTDRTLFTAIGSVVGTFEYMSPEQAELNQLDVDTRTDIYSLGVLLYELLTGTTPLDRRRLGEFALLELLRAIREDEPPRPSTRISTSEGSAGIAANRSMEPGKLSGMMRGELDWIVMRALEKDRTRRYETANGFAMDVQRYLADEQVLACPPSLGYRMRKFTRRNRVAIITATLVAAALVLGTIVSTWQAIRAETARKSERQQRLDADDARLAEAEQRKAAEEAHDQALANLRKAHEAVDRLLTRVGENEFSQTPHLQQLQRKLLEDALEFNENFLAITSDDHDLQLEAAVARLRVGIIKLQMGDFAGAEEACLLSLNKLHSLSEALPGDPRPRAEMVRACQNMGFVFDQTHPEGAQREEIRRRAVELINQLIKDFPERQEFQLGRASSYLYLGVALMNGHKQQEAESVLNRALEWSEELGETSLIGQCSHELARLYFESNCLDQAETSVRTAIDAFQRLDDGQDWYIRMTLAESHLRLRDILSRQGRAGEGETELVQSLSLWTALSRDYPDKVYFPDRLAYVADLLGEALQARGELVEAVVAYRRSVDAECRLIAREAENARHHDDLRHRFDRLDELLHQTGRTSERQQVADDVMAIYRSLLAEHPDDAALQTEWERFQTQWLRCRMQRGTVSEREQASREGIARLEKLAADAPDDSELKLALAHVYHDAATALWAAGRTDEAERGYRLAVALKEKLVAESPANPDYRFHLANSYLGLAYLMGATNRPEDSAEFYEQALAIFEKLAVEIPTQYDHRVEAGHILWQLGSLASAAGRQDDAEKYHRQALAVFEKLATDVPANPYYRQEQGFSNWYLGDLLKANGRLHDAEGPYRDAVVVYAGLAADHPDDGEYRARLSRSYTSLIDVLLLQGNHAEAEELMGTTVE